MKNYPNKMMKTDRAPELVREACACSLCAYARAEFAKERKSKGIIKNK